MVGKAGASSTAVCSDRCAALQPSVHVLLAHAPRPSFHLALRAREHHHP